MYVCTYNILKKRLRDLHAWPVLIHSKLRDIVLDIGVLKTSHYKLTYKIRVTEDHGPLRDFLALSDCGVKRAR